MTKQSGTCFRTSLRRMTLVSSSRRRTVKIVDLSRELYHRTPSYPGHPPVMHGVWKTHEESFAESGNVHGLASMFISMVDHAGTHIDAPRHFGKSGISIDQYPLEKCIVPGICIDLRHIAPRAEITPADLETAVKKAGVPVPKGGTVLLCTGHHERTFPRKEYSTRQFRRQRRRHRMAGKAGRRAFRHRLDAARP